MNINYVPTPDELITQDARIHASALCIFSLHSMTNFVCANRRECLAVVFYLRPFCTLQVHTRPFGD
jgi:hypothetical protein